MRKVRNPEVALELIEFRNTQLELQGRDQETTTAAITTASQNP